MKSSREQFEEWYMENFGHTEDHHETMFERDPDCPEDYYRFGVRLSHHSWQASRAAIVIELPDITDAQYQSKHIDGGFRAEAFWLHVRKCIARAGLKVKS